MVVRPYLLLLTNNTLIVLDQRNVAYLGKLLNHEMIQELVIINNI